MVISLCVCHFSCCFVFCIISFLVTASARAFALFLLLPLFVFAHTFFRCCCCCSCSVLLHIFFVRCSSLLMCVCFICFYAFRFIYGSVLLSFIFFDVMIYAYLSASIRCGRVNFVSLCVVFELGNGSKFITIA